MSRTTKISGVDVDISFMSEDFSPMDALQNFAKQWAEHRCKNSIVSHEVRISSIGTSMFCEECKLGLIQRFPDHKSSWEFLFTPEVFGEEVASNLYNKEEFLEFQKKKLMNKGISEEKAIEYLEFQREGVMNDN